MGTSPEVVREVEIPAILGAAIPERTLQQQEVRQLLEAWRPPQQPPQILRADDRFFSAVLLETPGVERKRRKVSAALSFIVQCCMLALVVLIPLWFTDALPKQQLLTFLVAPPPPPPPAAPEAARAVQRVTSELSDGSLRTPVRIPTKVQILHEEEAPPISGGVIGGVPGGIPGGQLGGVIGGILSSTNTAVVPKFSAPTPQRIRVSQGVTKGQLIEKAEAKYPPIALSARIQGVVVLKAIISKTGEIENLELVTGHPMLVPAALDAVKKWRYRPFLLNGVPVEVETMVTVTFQISG